MRTVDPGMGGGYTCRWAIEIPIPFPARIRASSTWAPKGTPMWEGPLPPNVKLVGRLDYPALRNLYAGARFAVLPLVPSVQAAGSTTAVEAMAMAKAVIASDVPGIADYVRQDITGFLVPPGNVPAMAQAIALPWEQPDEAQAMGLAGRQCTKSEMSLDHYVASLVTTIKGLSAW